MSRCTIIPKLLQDLEDKLQRDLYIVETGMIRNPNNLQGDGHSTLFICDFVKHSKYEHWFTSIDLDTEPCYNYLKSKGLLKYVYLVEKDSREGLKELSRYPYFDFVYLDTANNPELILEEFKIAEDKLHDDSIVMIDDATKKKDNLKKGDKVIEYCENKRGYNIEYLERAIVIRDMFIGDKE